MKRRCQCGAATHGYFGTCERPAIFAVIRDGRRLLVCEKCDLTTDQDIRVLPEAPLWRRFLRWLGVRS